MRYTLTFRLRPARADTQGRTGVTVDVYWPKGGYGAGHTRLNAVATGVRCAVAHWQPERDRQAVAAGRKPKPGARLIYTAEPNANALNLRLDRIRKAVDEVFSKADLRDEMPTPADVRAAIGSGAQPASARPTSVALPTPEYTEQLRDMFHEFLMFIEEKSVKENAPTAPAFVETISSTSQYVYLMHNQRNGYYKLGRSVNPGYREKTLQAEEPEISLIAKWLAPAQVEKQLHTAFASKRVRGEWFELSPDDLSIIRQLMESLSYSQ